MDCARFGKSCIDMTGIEPAGSCFVKPEPPVLNVRQISMKNALQRISGYCEAIVHCEDCMLYHICGFNKPQLKPPCDWNVKEIVRGCPEERVWKEGEPK